MTGPISLPRVGYSWASRIKCPPLARFSGRKKAGASSNYIRNFCQEEGWPPGDLNFLKPLFTSKALPENEVELRQRTLTAAALTVMFPSGDLGDGTFMFEPSFLSGIVLRQFVLQNQIQAILPIDEDRTGRQMRYRVAGSYLTSLFRCSLVPNPEGEFCHNLQGESNEVLLLPPPTL